MLQIGKLCCGCSACVNICPTQSISFCEDAEGFLYPNIDMRICIDCGLCENVCPINNQNVERRPLTVLAAKSDDNEIRMKSSSGGVFSLLAEKIIKDNGVVFGARFNDEWNVIHDYTETIHGLEMLRRSKYVQSNILGTYKQVERFLLNGRKVMFTGTPCQVAGLKRYLKKEYVNLLTVDFICHGVPSPLVWRRYLNDEIARQMDELVPPDPLFRLTGINFRDKSTGWREYSVVLDFSKEIGGHRRNKVLSSSVFSDNVYMKAFLSNLSLRTSCYNCSAKAGKSGADITLGDFWDIEDVQPELDDNKGLSLVLINNHHGEKFTDDVIIKSHHFGFDESVKKNYLYRRSVTEPINRAFFFYCIKKGDTVREAIHACESKGVLYRMRRLLYRKLGI